MIRPGDPSGSDGRRGGAVTRRQLVVGALFLGLTWLFGGFYGAMAGAAVLGAWLGIRMPVRAFWLGSVVLMALAPFALMLEGLPSRPVVGPGFGNGHMLAHVLVGLSLALAGLAGLLELSGEHPRSAEGAPGAWFRRLAGARVRPARRSGPAPGPPGPGDEPLPLE